MDFSGNMMINMLVLSLVICSDFLGSAIVNGALSDFGTSYRKKFFSLLQSTKSKLYLLFLEKKIFVQCL